MDGVQVGGCSWSQLTEMVNLETGESISNGIVSACNICYKDMYVILCCTKVKHMNKSHQFRAVGGSFLPYVHYCLVVTMFQYLFLWPRWPQVLTTEAMANSSFQAVSLLIWSSGHRAWIQFPEQCAPQPRVPDASVNKDIDEEVDQLVFKMHAVPFHVGRKASHQSTSRYASMHNCR